MPEDGFDLNFTGIFNIDKNDTRGATDATLNIYNQRVWTWWLKMIGTFIFAPIGLIGNTISIAVFKTSDELRKMPYMPYLIVLATSSSLILVIQLMNKGSDLSYYHGNGSLFAYHTEFTCKVWQFLRYTIYLLPVWVTVCFSFDRYMAICHPFRYRQNCMKLRWTILIVCFVLLSITQIYWLFGTKFRTNNKWHELNPRRRCSFKPLPAEAEKMYVTINGILHHCILSFLLPSAIIAFSNIAVGRQLHLDRQRHNRQTTLQDTEEERLQKRKSITLLFVVSFFLIVTHLPSQVLVTLSLINKYWCPSCIRYKGSKELTDVADLVTNAFHALNIFLYAWVYKSFKRQLRHFCSVKCRSRFGKRNIVPAIEIVPPTSYTENLADLGPGDLGTRASWNMRNDSEFHEMPPSRPTTLAIVHIPIINKAKKT